LDFIKNKDEGAEHGEEPCRASDVRLRAQRKKVSAKNFEKETHRRSTTLL
jgi:hypothetical protein